MTQRASEPDTLRMRHRRPTSFSSDDCLVGDSWMASTRKETEKLSGGRDGRATRSREEMSSGGGSRGWEGMPPAQVVHAIIMSHALVLLCGIVFGVGTGLTGIAVMSGGFGVQGRGPGYGHGHGHQSVHGDFGWGTGSVEEGSGARKTSRARGRAGFARAQNQGAGESDWTTHSSTYTSGSENLPNPENEAWEEPDNADVSASSARQYRSEENEKAQLETTENKRAAGDIASSYLPYHNEDSEETQMGSTENVNDVDDIVSSSLPHQSEENRDDTVSSSSLDESEEYEVTDTTNPYARYKEHYETFQDLPRYTDPSDRHHGEYDLLIRNANQSQPVLQHLDNALTEEEFQSVQECLIDHPMRHSNVNSDEAFGNTRGFVVSFNEEGITDLENHDLFKCLSPYFQRHRLPNCNAWILNMVWANVPAYDKEFAISRHTDDALIMDYPGTVKVLPYQTSVLYVFLPEDMEGGELETYPYDMEQEEMDATLPHGRIEPKLNRMAYFPGDSWHQVRSYRTNSSSMLRASLVLENYHVPPSLERFVVPFEWQDGKNNKMM